MSREAREAPEQFDLFGPGAEVIPLRRTVGPFEVHEHSFISGPRSWNIEKLVHSHEGGDQPHTHPDTGPSCYTIDKDDWFRRTGLKGGGRKKFTPKPTGEQLPLILRSPEESTFEVIVGDPPAEYKGEGAGDLPVVRIMLAFGMTAKVIDGRSPTRRGRGVA